MKKGVSIKMRTSIVVIFALSLVICGCAPTLPTESQDYRRIAGVTLDSLNTSMREAQPASIAELLDRAEFLSTIHFDIEINATRAQVIELEGTRLLARAFKLQQSNVHGLYIDSFIIPAVGPDYLFLPSLSAFDAARNHIAELTPEASTSVHAGAIHLRFEIPADTHYVAVHAAPQYLNRSINLGADGGLAPSTNYSGAFSNPGLAVGVGAVLGGAIGGAIAGALVGARPPPPGEPDDYYFGPGGVINIGIDSSEAAGGSK